jgi:DNA-binding NarL/FixJ family response regulator
MNPEELASVRLAIVDDSEPVRSGIRLMLSGEHDFDIIGEAADGREAVELCRRTRPKLVLMDVRMPRMDGLTATRVIKQEFPNTSVLMLTMHDNKDYLLEAIRAGAAGYVLKDAPQHELATAIRKVREGETSLNRNLATRLLWSLANETQVSVKEDSAQRRAELSQPLTPREVEVLELLAEGHTNRRIAQDLGISVGTAKNHVEHIIAKLEVLDRTQAVVQALELGIISFPKR